MIGVVVIGWKESNEVRLSRLSRLIPPNQDPPHLPPHWFGEGSPNWRGIYRSSGPVEDEGRGCWVVRCLSLPVKESENPKKREPARNTKVVEEAEETEAQQLAPEGNQGKDNETMWALRARR